jgi:hypothetical protein
VALVLKIALGIILAVVVMSLLFRFEVTVGPVDTNPVSTISTDEKLCAEGYQPSCDAIGR